MSNIKTPTNQKRLTNVAIVKYMAKSNNKKQKFEIACYPNKVIPWRVELETDLDQVLQAKNIYVDVSQAKLAGSALLQEFFDTTNNLDIIHKILAKGELNVTEKERQAQQENLIKHIAKLVAGKTINPETKTYIPCSVIEQMIKESHINLKFNKPAKEQCLQVIKILKSKPEYSIVEAQISAVIKFPSNKNNVIKKIVNEFCNTIIKEENDEIIALFEPGQYECFNSEYGSSYDIVLNEIVSKENNASSDRGVGDVDNEDNDSLVAGTSADTMENNEENSKNKKKPRRAKKDIPVIIEDDELAAKVSELSIDQESDEDTPLKGKRGRKQKNKKK